MHHDPETQDQVEIVDETKTLREAIAKAPPALKRWTVGLLVGCVLVAGGMAFYKHLRVSQEEAVLQAEAAAGPRVKVVTVARSQGVRRIELLGEAKPFASVTLYAKLSGYLKDVKVDKGDKVKKGQILAVIESPETIKSYEGAEADAGNKESVSLRMASLYEKKFVSAQEYDQAVSDAKVAKSRFDSLAVQKDYQYLRAPFDGTITARFADPGALVQNAANSQTSSLPVATLANVDKLRVYVYLDQRDAPYVTPGRVALIRLPERPGVEIKAEVTRVAGELDDRSHTLLTEIDVDNNDAKIVAGSFVQVALQIETPRYLEAPAEGLVVQGDKYFLPVVSADHVMNLKEVKVADNDGKTVRLLSGVEEGDSVALNLGNSLASGSRVRPIVADSAPTQVAPKAAEKLSEKPATEKTTATSPAEKSGGASKKRDPSAVGIRDPEAPTAGTR